MQNIARQAVERETDRVSVDVTRGDLAQKRFGFCDGVELNYSALDYYYIPGLYRGSGFLTPVFFSKDALTYFYHHPDYSIEFASDTYGTLRKKSGDYISFGLNRNGKLIMWLGDLNDLPRKDLLLLAVHSVESDHDLASEFYEGQIEAEFTELSQERRIIRAQGRFAGEVFEQFSGLKLLLMDAESLSVIAGVRPPLHFTEVEFGNSVEALTKLLIERINTSVLKTDLRGCVTQKEMEEVEKLAGLRTLQLWLERRLNLKDSAETMLPLFVLYDLWVGFKHLIGSSKRSKMLISVKDRLGLAEDSTLQDIYRKLTAGLESSFDGMFKALPMKKTAYTKASD